MMAVTTIRSGSSFVAAAEALGAKRIISARGDYGNQIKIGCEMPDGERRRLAFVELADRTIHLEPGAEWARLALEALAAREGWSW